VRSSAHVHVDDDLELTPEEEAELDDAIAEADRVGWILPNS
jgi:hypothetical protein